METPLNNQGQHPSEQHSASLKDSVLKHIADGSVSVTPKWRFTATAILSVMGILFGFLMVLFVLSLIEFSLQQSGVTALPAFGADGVRELLFSLPWIPILLIILSAALLEYWLLHYAFAYRRPVLYSVLGIVAFFVLGTFIVASAKIHESVYEVAERDNVPLIQPFYHAVTEQDLPKLHRGMVAELEEHGFLMRGREGKTVEVFVTDDTRIAPPVAVRVGDMVIVFGQYQSGQIQAIGVKHMDFPPFMMDPVHP